MIGGAKLSKAMASTELSTGSQLPDFEFGQESKRPKKDHDHGESFALHKVGGAQFARRSIDLQSGFLPDST
jgi:hypothetical protein